VIAATAASFETAGAPPSTVAGPAIPDRVVGAEGFEPPTLSV
jgi:hypothetical protein